MRDGRMLQESPGVRVALVPVAADGEARRSSARAAAASALAALAGVGDPEVRVTARCPDCGGDHGRPVAELADGRLGAVSIAHPLPGVAVIAAALGVDAIGVDAEPDGPEARARAAEALPGVDDPLRAWVRGEAVLKADGRGLRVDPASVRWDDDVARVPGSDRSWRVTDLAAPGLAVALALPVLPMAE